MCSFLIPRSCECYLPRQKVNIRLSFHMSLYRWKHLQIKISLQIVLDLAVTTVSSGEKAQEGFIHKPTDVCTHKHTHILTVRDTQAHESEVESTQLNQHNQKPRSIKKSLKPLKAVKGKECEFSLHMMMPSFQYQARAFRIGGQVQGSLTTPQNYLFYLIYLTQSLKVYLGKIPSN